MNVMAIAMAIRHPTDAIAIALASFKGIRRRFSYQIKTDDLVYIDDYIIQLRLMQSIRRLGNYIPKKVLALFQPHLFSRTKDFADDFAKSLSPSYC
jgi:UDP-N-acetylmuramate--alanine ligase